MASNDRGVPRGDHVAGEQDKADSVDRQEANTRGEGIAADAASRSDARDGSAAIDKRGPDKS